MNFKFYPTFDTRNPMRKRELEFFSQARNERGLVSAAISRKWVKEVVEYFGRQINLPFDQAWQLVRCGEFNHGQAMHGRHFDKSPRFVIDKDGKKVANPIAKMHLEYFEMEPLVWKDIARKAWLDALTLRHPSDHVSDAKPKDIKLAAAIIETSFKGKKKNARTNTRQAVSAKG